MPAKRIDGEALAARIRADLADDLQEVVRVSGHAPALVSVMVGANPGGRVYARSLAAACGQVGIDCRLVDLSGDTTSGQLGARLSALGAEADVDGLLLQMPLPAGLNARDVAEHIPPEKDVEGLTSHNLGRLFFYEPPDLVPATAAAAYELIRFAGCQLHGAEAVVVGHSPIVGKPVACLLANDLATCTICHVGTRDLAAHTRAADVLVVAVGKPGLITAEHVRPGATVIDVGISRVPVFGPDGEPVLAKSGRPKMKTVGDVDAASVRPVAGALTPVPGGVGPVTVAMIMRNTVRAAQARWL